MVRRADFVEISLDVRTTAWHRTQLDTNWAYWTPAASMSLRFAVALSPCTAERKATA
jgi:hypothetical protein